MSEIEKIDLLWNSHCSQDTHHEYMSGFGFEQALTEFAEWVRGEIAGEVKSYIENTAIPFKDGVINRIAGK
jgi:hypothetical protein